MLKTEKRLKRKRDFERVFQKGRGFKESFLFLKLVDTDFRKARFGIIVSKKVSGKAALRNRIRRRVREAIRRQLSKVKEGRGGFDAVVSALPGAGNKDFWEVEEALSKLFKKAKIISQE